MFKLIANVEEALSPGLQVVVTEHADLDEDWYQDAVVERWRGGRKLVPDDWGESRGRDGLCDAKHLKQRSVLYFSHIRMLSPNCPFCGRVSRHRGSVPPHVRG